MHSYVCVNVVLFIFYILVFKSLYNLHVFLSVFARVLLFKMVCLKLKVAWFILAFITHSNKNSRRYQILSNLAFKCVRLAPNGTNMELFKISSVHLGSARQNVLKLILKSPIFVPFGVNLTQFKA